MISWNALKEITGMLGPLLGGGGVWAYLSARHKSASSSPASITTSQSELVNALNEQTEMLLDESTKYRRDLKRRLDSQGRKLTKVLIEIDECHKRHDECEENVSGLRAQIAKMVANGPVATYPHGGASVTD